jgi:hypothetical protein
MKAGRLAVYFHNTYVHDHGTIISTINHAIIFSLKVKVSLEQATKAQRGSSGIALLFP